MNESNTAFALKVSGWLASDIRRHIFILVWVCGVPVHVRYIIQLLRMSAATVDILTASLEGSSSVEFKGTHAKKDAILHDVNSTIIRNSALDIAFTQVGSDCCEAHRSVVAASLVREPWSTVRSLSCVGVSDGAASDGVVTEIASNSPTVKGEVLALLPPGEVSQAELRAAYFTAVDQARRFEQLYEPHNINLSQLLRHGSDERNAERWQQSAESIDSGSRADVVLIDDSDDDRELMPNRGEVVVISDDSEVDFPVRKRSRLSQISYEILD
ncbi:unnamed protein product [Trypanosoma congolense IL3000]|uniref:WGS project CAEQ00000000 data, annotated contig 343 n=1 Tax=Trypanosoma congolense (strain IL3000) TaxID=1068625 RepID=F9WF31_TRYCI|nr:unnamed protein product [Trypanosoma congolense IL3000]